MYVCMYICVHVCVCEIVCIICECVYVRAPLCVCKGGRDSASEREHLCACAYMYVCSCVCARTCVHAREREGEREKKRARVIQCLRAYKRVYMFVGMHLGVCAYVACICVCVRMWLAPPPAGALNLAAPDSTSDLNLL